MSDLIETNTALSERETIIQQLTRGEAEVQAALAKRFPRDYAISLKRTETMATANPDVAGACFYAMPRGDSMIEGPSIRLAEIAAQNWGNLRASASVIETAEETVTARGVCWDLETNYFISETRSRRILNKYGKRYNNDMINVTSNAACKIALREAIFSCIGKTVLDPIWQQCRIISIGESRSITDAWQKCCLVYAKAGIDEARLLGRVGRESAEDVTRDDLATMRGLLTALRDNETSIEQAFPRGAGPAEDGTRSFGFKGKGGQSAAPAQQNPPAPAPGIPAAAEQDLDTPARAIVFAKISEQKIDVSKVVDLMQLKKEELGIFADHLGLDVRGTKGKLSERIAGYYNRKRAEAEASAKTKTDQKFADSVNPAEKTGPLPDPAPPARGDFEVEPPSPPDGTSADDMPAWDQGGNNPPRFSGAPPPGVEPPHDPKTGETPPPAEPPPHTDEQQPSFGFKK